MRAGVIMWSGRMDRFEPCATTPDSTTIQATVNLVRRQDMRRLNVSLAAHLRDMVFRLLVLVLGIPSPSDRDRMVGSENSWRSLV